MKAPTLKKVSEDTWSVTWDDICVEFIYDMCGDKLVTIYPAPSGKTRMHQDVPLTYGKSVVCFHNVEEVKTMAEEKKKISKKEGKEAKKKDYYAGKEVKAQ